MIFDKQIHNQFYGNILNVSLVVITGLKHNTISITLKFDLKNTLRYKVSEIFRKHFINFKRFKILWLEIQGYQLNILKWRTGGNKKIYQASGVQSHRGEKVFQVDIWLNFSDNRDQQISKISSSNNSICICLYMYLQVKQLLYIDSFIFIHQSAFAHNKNISLTIYIFALSLLQQFSLKTSFSLQQGIILLAFYILLLFRLFQQQLFINFDDQHEELAHSINESVSEQNFSKARWLILSKPLWLRTLKLSMSIAGKI